jgi:hypothetical protein
MTSIRKLSSAVDVGQERHLACPLDGDSDLVVVTAARSGDAARPDPALLGQGAAKDGDVGEVDVARLLVAVATGTPSMLVWP